MLCRSLRRMETARPVLENGQARHWGNGLVFGLEVVIDFFLAGWGLSGDGCGSWRKNAKLGNRSFVGDDV